MAFHTTKQKNTMQNKTLQTLIVLGALLIVQLSFSQSKISGFSEDGAKEQMVIEKEMDQLINPQNIDEWVKYMSAEPHHVGSPYTKKVVEFMEKKFNSWGYDTKIEEYHVLFPTPKTRLVELLEPEKFTAKLFESAYEEDPATQQRDLQLPPFNAFSIDGDVTAELVFVNYGIPADYELLDQMGIDVKGKIVIAKYAGSWRGIKPKLAAEKGAIGCLIYSDPKDDGYFRGDVYPKGAFKPEYGVQRGAVMDLPLRPGDPLTPYVGATKKAKRIDRSEAETLTKIPVLPISYQDALPLLRALGGEVVPNPWKGALPITYHTGPGPAKVRLKVEFNWDIKPAYNVVATMKGSTYPDEWIIRGNHHDAWVHGASDPISGMAALMEEARVVAELAKKGQAPLRTIKYIGWDAEEPGLLGSTEWVEHHAEELREKAVAYINTDGNSRGYIYGGGSHAFEKLWNEVINEVTDPQTGKSIAERRKAIDAYYSPDAQKLSKLNAPKLNLSALGSGSDYSPFFQHLGISSFNIGFGGEGSGGEYHTIYDTYNHYSTFKDPGFEYGGTLAKTAGRLTLRLANSTRLPFYYSNLHTTIEGYLKEVIELADNKRASAERTNQLLESNLYELVKDPLGRNQTFKPQKQKEVPHFNFADLQNALEDFGEVCQKVDASDTGSINSKLYRAEQQLIHAEGLPRRPWYRHVIYAPGFYTGYGVKTLPGIREAIEQEDWEEVQVQIDLVTSKIRMISKFLSE